MTEFGLLNFGPSGTVPRTPEAFPRPAVQNPRRFIATFWADATSDSNVYHQLHVASGPAFEMARDDIMTAFCGNFTPHRVFVVTWNGVQARQSQSDPDSGEVGMYDYTLIHLGTDNMEM